MSYSYMSMINHTAAAGGLCETNEMISQISNLTASYAGNGGKELLMLVSAPIIMFILVGFFFGGMFCVSSSAAVLDPKFRFLLSSALAIFLLVMSYLFSEAKDDDKGAATSEELSVRARVILTWLLLVELLRKKVDEIRTRGSYSATIQRAGRVVWLGSLVYFNITSPGRKAVFSVLWILCATKLLQRVVFAEVEKRSYPDKSWIISSYMKHIKMARPHLAEDEQQPQVNYSDLEQCPYIVVGEEKLINTKRVSARVVSAEGYYKLDLDMINISHDIITVGQVLDQTEGEKHCLSLGRDTVTSIRRVCLSFALFKLLRLRMEFGSTTASQEQEAYYCRDLMLNMLPANITPNRHPNIRPTPTEELWLEPKEEQSVRVEEWVELREETTEASSLIFQVLADELTFAGEYYHSVVPVVLASPTFVLVNYFLLPVVILGLCLVALAVCGNGDVRYALSRMRADNYALQPGFGSIARCTIARAMGRSQPAAFFMVDAFITLLLFLIFFLEEVWELLVVVASNWFMISTFSMWVLLRRRLSTTTGGVRRWRVLINTSGFALWLWRKMGGKRSSNIRMKQLSLLDRPRPVPLLSIFSLLMPAATLSLKLRTRRSVPATVELKQSIMDCLKQHVMDPLTNGLDPRYYELQLVWACKNECVTELILTWHIATCLLESRFSLLRITGEAVVTAQEVAMSLSRYCAYLVVSHPELLPDRRAKVELVVQEAEEMLRDKLGFWAYYLAPTRSRVNRLLDLPVLRDSHHVDLDRPWDSNKGDVVLNGLLLGTQLIKVMENGSTSCEELWKLLANFWTELIVYAAPSSNEEAHKGNLAEGVELITVLWAFALHTGMARPQLDGF